MLTIVIQAGGESRRMGQDKGLVLFLGQPLIQRVVGRLSSLADEILVTTNRPEAYQFLNLPLFPDLIPGRGALGGLYTALHSASQPLVGVIACDMPFVSSELLSLERDLLQSSQADIVIPRVADGLEPFHAVYRRESCLGPVEEVLQSDKWRVDAWFSKVKLHILREEELREVDPELLSFRNVNTPEELEEAERLARLVDRV